jgi:adenosylcobinamide-GDP ribazoletransferase
VRRRLVAVTRSLVLAIGFTSILPVPMVRARRLDFALAVGWFPVCGLALGALLAAANALLPDHWPALVRATLLVAMLAWLTRALHLDGVVDTFDGIGGGMGNRERTLTIMRDPRAGTFGVVAVVVVLALKIAALSVLLSASAVTVLLVFPVVSRWVGAFLPALFRKARADGLGQLMVTPSRPTSALSLLALGIGLVGLVAGWDARLVLAVSISVAVVLFAALSWRRVLGGLTGDTYGAAIEIAEVVLLLALI